APLRALAVRALVGRGENVTRFLDPAHPPAVRLEAVAGLRAPGDIPRLLQLLADADPSLRNAAVQQLAHRSDLLDSVDPASPPDPRIRIGLLLAHQATGRPASVRRWPQFFADQDEEVRFLAAKWAADQKLATFRSLLADALRDQSSTTRLTVAC